MRLRNRKRRESWGAGFALAGSLIWGCAANSGSPLAPVVGKADALPASTEVTGAPDTLGHLVFLAVSCPIALAPWPLRIAAPKAGTSVDQSRLASLELQLEGSGVQELGQLWVRFDQRLPRPVPGPVFTFGHLLDAPAEVQPGVHRVTVYAGRSDGTALFSDPRRVLASSISVFVTGGAVPDDPYPATGNPEPTPVQVFGPALTLNGSAEVEMAQFQIAGNISQEYRVRVTAPGGARSERLLRGGCYSMSGLISGDYELRLTDPRSEAKLVTVFTVNLD